jgi:hypothetical protein
LSAAVGKSSVHGTVAGSPYTVADDEKIMALHLFIHSFTGRMEDGHASVDTRGDNQREIDGDRKK